MVRALTAELIPVVGHLGFVPRKSTWVGGVRAVGKDGGRSGRALGPFSAPRGRRRVRRRMRADPRRCHVGDQPVHLACHDLVGIRRERRRDFPIRLRHLRRVVQAAASCAGVGRSRKSIQGREGGESEGAIRLPGCGRIRRLPRRGGDCRHSSSRTGGIPRRHGDRSATRKPTHLRECGEHRPFTRRPERIPVDFLAVPEIWDLLTARLGVEKPLLDESRYFDPAWEEILRRLEVDCRVISITRTSSALRRSRRFRPGAIRNGRKVQS